MGLGKGDSNHLVAQVPVTISQSGQEPLVGRPRNRKEIFSSPFPFFFKKKKMFSLLITKKLENTNKQKENKKL